MAASTYKFCYSTSDTTIMEVVIILVIYIFHSLELKLTSDIWDPCNRTMCHFATGMTHLEVSYWEKTGQCCSSNLPNKPKQNITGVTTGC